MSAGSRIRRGVVAATLAVGALTVSPAASAHTGAPADPRACPAPQVAWAYDPATFTAWATLPVSGCPTREDGRFPLWLSITRSDPTSIHGADRGTLCGPYPSSSESGGRHFACDIERSVDHPETEQASYDLFVTYPGDDGTETLAVNVVCTSSDAGASCTEDDPR